MKPIVLVGPSDTEPALVSFAEYLGSSAIPYWICSELTELRFGVSIEANGHVQARLHLPEFGTLSGDQVTVFIRNPSSFLVSGRGRDARFIAKEYHSSLWALCALLPSVINRPQRSAWLYDRELKHLVPALNSPPEHWTTDLADLLRSWDLQGTAEMHVEDLVTFERKVCSRRQDLATWRRGRSKVQLRALFMPSSKYIVHIGVGDWHTTVLNEAGHDTGSPEHIAILKDISRMVSRQGIRFFAVVLVVNEDRLSLVRILPEPPFAWYLKQADAVHEQLLWELQRPFPPPRDLSWA
jgi:hypothetical protein